MGDRATASDSTVRDMRDTEPWSPSLQLERGMIGGGGGGGREAEGEENGERRRGKQKGKGRVENGREGKRENNRMV